MGFDVWTECTVDEIKSTVPNALSTGPFGSAISSRYFIDHGVPVIRGGNLSQDVGVRLRDDRLVFVSNEKAKEFSRSVARRGDLVFTCWGTIDQVGLIDDRSRFPEYVVSNKQMKLTPDPEKASSLFLYYLFSSPMMRERILNQGIGSSVPGFNLGQLRSIKLNLPPLPEQRAIAHILGTLDDKIELSRRMNETLEAMARTLFKSWFIDFDPARAKAKGRDPGLPMDIANLFPDSFEDSELGRIPSGWRVSTLGKEAETLLGGTPSRAEPSYWGGDIPWINSGMANEFRIIEPTEFITQKGCDSSSTKMLPARTTVIAITGATLGQISIAEIDTCANQSIVGVLGSPSLPTEFIYFWLKENVQRLVANQTGGAQQHINKNNVNDLPITCPGNAAIDAFVAFARPVFDRIKTSCLESRTIAAVRDLLLPELISGQVRIETAETLVEGAR